MPSPSRRPAAARANETGGVIRAETFDEAVKLTTAAAAKRASTAPAKAAKEAETASRFGAAVSGAGYMFVLQVFSKLVTFTCNQLVLRKVSPQIFGVASIQLELLVSTLLFFAREPLRLAALRVPVVGVKGNADLAQLQSIVNLAWIAPAVGAPLAALLAAYYIRYLPVPELAAWYSTSVVMYAAGAWLDLMAEPFFTVHYSLLFLKTRAIIEGLALTASCGTAFYLSWWHGESMGLLAFAYARIAFGATYFGAFVAAFVWHSVKSEGAIPLAIVVPKPVTVTIKEKTQTRFFDTQLLGVAWSFLTQSLLKHVLTEGDKFVLSQFYTPYHQGVYAVIFNYGSIVTRIVLLPLEDAARLIFTRLRRDEYSTTARNLLELATKFHVFLGALCVAIGTHYTDTLLSLLVGAQWGSTADGMGGAPAALAAYCWLIPVLGINGITEAFVTSVATPADVREQSAAFVAAAAVFAGVAYLVYPWGAAGLFIANAVHLLVRIAWSQWFIDRTLGPLSPQELLARLRAGHGGWDAWLPVRPVLHTLALSWLVTRWSRNAFITDPNAPVYPTAHLAVGVGCGVLCLFTVFRKDHEFAMRLWRLRKGQRIAVTGDQSDVRIVVCGKSYALHRVMLAQSPFFRALLSDDWHAPVDNCAVRVDFSLSSSAGDDVDDTEDETSLARTLYAWETAIVAIYGACPKIMASRMSNTNLMDLLEAALYFVKRTALSQHFWFPSEYALFEFLAGLDFPPDEVLRAVNFCNMADEELFQAPLATN
ncbi:Oligosaccharide translocation protein rft1 [Blastocladiella emersonii ATCC 22665]|nr:Oligosaccharide translocation protein rft1 [Blastocladiella emersonii ATCC 22665]